MSQLIEITTTITKMPANNYITLNGLNLIDFLKYQRS